MECLYVHHIASGGELGNIGQNVLTPIEIRLVLMIKRDSDFLIESWRKNGYHDLVVPSGITLATFGYRILGDALAPHRDERKRKLLIFGIIVEWLQVFGAEHLDHELVGLPVEIWRLDNTQTLLGLLGFKDHIRSGSIFNHLLLEGVPLVIASRIIVHRLFHARAHYKAGNLKVPKYSCGRIWLGEPEPLFVNIAVRLAVHSAEADRVASNQLVCEPVLLVVNVQVQLQRFQLKLVQLQVGKSELLIPDSG